ncbi:hypothetical protein AAFF_G00328940 [Aldrovandia affinis]|uniref:Ig-like domain-containing protein n=1 Tax=Aldrovandia affinis TaxID=143900 RepID=A0AAD7SML6_9TELE|nr:hypothetical protein AAFF_G00328940 [Aldrovandia affinis]
MTAAERFILIGCLLQGALGREWGVWMPQSIEALSGSCVLIPCRFEIPSEYDKDLAEYPDSVHGLWRKGSVNGYTVYNSGTRSPITGKITGDLLQKSCTTILNNFSTDYSGKYYFRLECPNVLKWTFEPAVQINAKDSPPKPKLTPMEVKVTEGTSVSLRCSAAAPCPTLPPKLTWTPRLSDSVDQLQENQDQTKYVTSVLTFTASHLHHGQKIICMAVYKRQRRNSQKISEASLTLNILYSPKNTSVSVSPSGSVLEGSSVTLTCSSDANPPVQNYTWYKVNGRELNTVGSGQKLIFNVTEPSDSGQYYCEAQNEHGMENSTVLLDVTYTPKSTSVSVNPSGSVLEGSSVTLTCSSDANPPVQNYTWYKVNGRELNTVGSGQKLTFNVTEPSDSGQYYCEAQNEHGKENSTVLLDVTYTPKSTSVSVNPSGSVLEGSSVTLTCSSDANPPVQNYTWYKVNGRELNTVGSGQKLTFNVTEPSDSGQYYCEAQNEHGKENSTVLLDVTLSTGQDCGDRMWREGFSIAWLLIGVVAGAGAMTFMCLLKQLILKKKRGKQCSGNSMKDTQELILNDGEEQSVYANKTVLLGAQVPSTIEIEDSDALHYANVDFSKLRGKGDEAGTGAIWGVSERTSDYALIRHKSRKETREEGGGGEEEEKEGEPENKREGSIQSSTEAPNGQIEPDRKEQGESEPLKPEPEEEATYGNICRSQASMQENLGQTELCGDPAPAEEHHVRGSGTESLRNNVPQNCAELQQRSAAPVGAVGIPLLAWSGVFV